MKELEWALISRVKEPFHSPGGIMEGMGSERAEVWRACGCESPLQLKGTRMIDGNELMGSPALKTGLPGKYGNCWRA